MIGYCEMWNGMRCKIQMEPTEADEHDLKEIQWHQISPNLSTVTVHEPLFLNWFVCAI